MTPAICAREMVGVGLGPLMVVNWEEPASKQALTSASAWDISASAGTPNVVRPEEMVASSVGVGTAGELTIKVMAAKASGFGAVLRAMVG